MQQSACHLEGQAWQIPELGQSSLCLHAITYTTRVECGAHEMWAREEGGKAGAASVSPEGATSWEPLVKSSWEGWAEGPELVLQCREAEFSTKTWDVRLSSGWQMKFPFGAVVRPLSPASASSCCCSLFMAHSVLLVLWLHSLATTLRWMP